MSNNKKTSKKPIQVNSTQNDFVKPDLTFPNFMDELRNLSKASYEEFKNRIQHIKKLTWQQIYDSSTKSPKNKTGLNWELLPNQKTVDDCPVASIRITESFRARVSRKNEVMRFISLHPDHDSTYKK